MSGKGVFRWLCWLPPASMLAAEVYIGRFDGWGAWAAAPLLLVPALISVAVALPGVFHVVGEVRAGAFSKATLLYVLIASLPIIWLSIRRFLL